MEKDATIDPLIDENIGLLRTGLQVMAAMPAPLYSEGHDRATDGGVGRHFRHVVEFYEQLLHRKGGTVDYESRRRDARVETDPAHAASVVEGLIALLEALRSSRADAPLAVTTEVLDADGSPVVTPSSVGRELASLASHTIHHYAIIAFLLRGSGVKLPRHFGVAPSTVRHIASRVSR